MFYAIVAAFFVSMLIVFFEMMADHRPNMTIMDSLTKVNLGMSFPIDALHIHYIDKVQYGREG